LFNTAKTSTTTSSVTIPTASTKEELVKSLEAHPETKELLQLELDTLGEDWLLALQGELTKSYFLNVSASSRL
jgi:uracil-DNA glycosylase